MKKKKGLTSALSKKNFKCNSQDQDVARTGVYYSAPFGVRDGKYRISVIGESKQLKAYTDLYKKSGVNLTVISMTDAKPLSMSPLSTLTEKQRTVLRSAFEHGYYDMPRKIDSQGLAKILRSSELNCNRAPEKGGTTTAI